MSKKRVVEFYLSAMMKAATGGQVTRLAYIYYDLKHTEVVQLDYTSGTGGVVVEFSVNDMGLLEIAAEVISQTRRALA